MKNNIFYKFKPTFFENDVYNINFEKYYKKGYRALIFDIDNTLVLHDQEIDDKCLSFLQKLKSIGFNISILSNNSKNRVESFVDKINCPYIYNANKPNKLSYLKLIDMLNVNISEVLFIGDQLFTDILGANNANISSILVKPIGKEKYLFIKIKRIFEKIILLFIRRNKWIS